MPGLGRARLQKHPEQPAGARKVALPEGVTGIVGERGVKHALDLRARLEPARQLQRVPMVPLEPNREGAQPAERLIAVVRRDVAAEIVHAVAQPRIMLLGHGDDAHHQVRVPADVLGGCVDRDVEAVPERLEVQPARPGVIQHAQHAALSGHPRDGRDVLHFEGERARQLQEEDPGVRPDQGFDPGADQRVVVGRLDAEARQHAVAELAGRRVGGIDHQQVVAGGEEGHQGLRDRGLARAGDDRTMGAVQGGDRILECEGGRRAAPPVVDAAQLTRPFERLDRLVQDGRGPIDRRIDHAVIAVRVAPFGGQ